MSGTISVKREKMNWLKQTQNRLRETFQKGAGSRGSKVLLLGLALTLPVINSRACTIFSGIGKDGSVWNGNNEDGVFSFAWYLNVFPKTADSRFGYFTLSADSPKNGEDANIQGGMNEAGLTFDFNALDRQYEVKDFAKKKEYPKGDGDILRHILADFATVEEVVSFFDAYWFQRGFTGAQMHVADKHGHFAMIGPSGSQILTNAPFQLSTNFRICGGSPDEGASCWRFPIAKSMLEKNGASLESFTDISRRTVQNPNAKLGEGTTIYSNIANLTTGDFWFFFGHDYTAPFKSNIKDILGKGRKSYLIRDLCRQQPLKKAS